MPRTAPEIIYECLGLISGALSEYRNRRFETAKRFLTVAVIQAAKLPEALREGYNAALCYCTLLVQSRVSPAAVTPEVRSRASILLDHCAAWDSIELFQKLMFEILTEFGEHRRAIAYGERCLAMAVETKQSVKIADRLWKIGKCYSRLGLRDHAASAYRASVRIFRNEPADPRLPVVLLALGNSIRKSSPPEAEQLYKEAAALWEAKGQLESATPAWMNLGVVCSDQERFEEAINYYERVRRVREANSGTPRAQIGVLYNNLASCYRKMARFADAHQAIEHALDILTQPGALGVDDGNSLGSTLGTKGMILRDEGRDLESLEWFRRACAQFEKQPSPNVENVIDELEHEAVALTRLNRTEETRAVEEKIQLLRKSAAETPGMSHDANAPVELTDGALLIELDRGMRTEPTTDEIVELGLGLGDILKEQQLGEWQSFVRIPECSTLFCYGPNAQAMFEALEPTLRQDARFEGAVITVRQRTEQREVVIPRKMVN
jgi:tetratricopeptide (TPR) repeat protein